MSKDRKTIMFTIEHKEREFLPKCFLALFLAKRGFRVYLGSFQAIDELAKNLKPSIFFHKSTHVNKSAFYRSLGHKFVLMDEEGGVTMPRSSIADFCKWRYRTVSPKREDLVFMPGRRYYDAVKKMDNVTGVKLHVTGWPRVDLWREKYFKIHDGEVKKIKMKHGKFYLLITSFGAGKKSSFSEFIKSSPDEVLTKIRKHKYNAFLDYAEMIEGLSKLLNDDEKIIIRPHPSEKISDWRQTVKGLKKVEIIREGDISPWILSAKSIIQYGSTTATQAALNGKVCVQYKIKEQIGVTDTPSFDLCEDASTPEDVYKFLSGASADPNIIMKRAVEVLKAEMAFDEDQPAVDAIVKVLDSEAMKPVPEVSLGFFSKLRVLSYYYRSAIKFFIQKIGFSGIKGKTAFEKIPGGITANEVSEAIHRLQEVEGWIGVSEIEDVAKNLVCIEPCSDVSAKLKI
jgi:surface carbohydrate biosynthesis protein